MQVLIDSTEHTQHKETFKTKLLHIPPPFVKKILYEYNMEGEIYYMITYQHNVTLFIF